MLLKNNIFFKEKFWNEWINKYYNKWPWYAATHLYRENITTPNALLLFSDYDLGEVKNSRTSDFLLESEVYPGPKLENLKNVFLKKKYFKTELFNFLINQRPQQLTRSNKVVKREDFTGKKNLTLKNIFSKPITKDIINELYKDIVYFLKNKSKHLLLNKGSNPSHYSRSGSSESSESSDGTEVLPFKFVKKIKNTNIYLPWNFFP